MKPFKFNPTRLPAKIDAEIIRIAAEVSPGSLPVFVDRRDHPGAIADQAPYNASRYASTQPAEVITGWKITVWDKVLVHLAGHAIVKDSSGPFCVTPGEEDKILFLADASVPLDQLSSTAWVPTRIEPVGTNSFIKRFIEACGNEASIRQQYPRTQDTQIIDAEKSKLHALEISKQAAMLNIILATHGKDAPCVCGNQKPFRKCHKPSIETLIRSFK